MAGGNGQTMSGSAVRVEIDPYPPPAIATPMETSRSRRPTTSAVPCLLWPYWRHGAPTSVRHRLQRPLQGSRSFGASGFGWPGSVFSTGLIAVVIGGAELFTGNNLIVVAFATGRVSIGGLLRNWAVVYVGNLVGSLLTLAVMLIGRRYTFGNGVIGANALATASARCTWISRRRLPWA